MDARRLVGWNVRRIRVERDLSIETLAGEAALEPSYLAKLERGEINSTVLVLAKLAKSLRAPLDQLFQPFPVGAKAPKPLPGGRRSHVSRKKKG